MTYQLVAFIAASFVVAVASGPGMLYVISRGLEGGRRAGVVAALGTSFGIGLHIVAAALGLSVLIQASGVAFQVLRWSPAHTERVQSVDIFAP